MYNLVLNYTYILYKSNMKISTKNNVLMNVKIKIFVGIPTPNKKLNRRRVIQDSD